MKWRWIRTTMLAAVGGGMALFLLFASSNDTVSRAELEARARAADQARAELRAEIEENQRAIHNNQVGIAELRTELKVWGTILAGLTGSGVLISVFKRHKS